MNTPAHALLNLALLGRGPRRAASGPILAGALLPDLPMFLFYAVQRLAVGLPEREIWSQAYFEPGWQQLFDVFNSAPLAALGLGWALWRGRTHAQLFFASVLLHVLADLPLHREDAHAHFLPFSSWRFVSPISYWDPAHYGAWAALAETLAVCAAASFLWRRHPAPPARAVLATLAVLQVAVFAAVYVGGLA